MLHHAAGGHQVADIALVYPVESPGYVLPPRRGGSPVSGDGACVERIFHDAEKDLYLSQRDFTHIDARTLAEATVDGGVLQYRDLAGG